MAAHPCIWPPHSAILDRPQSPLQTDEFGLPIQCPVAAGYGARDSAAALRIALSFRIISRSASLAFRSKYLLYAFRSL